MPGDFCSKRTREATAYSPSLRSNTHLVYTTEDLGPRAVELTRFFGEFTPKKARLPARRYLKLIDRVDARARPASPPS
jgi:hypothetical protein